MKLIIIIILLYDLHNMSEVIDITMEKLSNIIKKKIRDNVIYKIIGTINNIHPSGCHLYFNIKNNNIEIGGIIWNYENIKNDMYELEPEYLYEFIGKLDYYEKSNKINFIADDFNLVKKEENKIEILKNKFEQQGLIKLQNTEITKKINILGIITSINGAAITDILSMLRKNSFKGLVIIKNCITQGKHCPQSIMNALDWFYNNIPVNALIISRGGGTDSDLSGYSDEKLCKKVSKCNYMTISAIGHERDIVLLDYVCDYRASTPTMAAELVSKYYMDYNKNISLIENKLEILKNKIKKNIDQYKHTVSEYKKNMRDPKEDIIRMEQQLCKIKQNILKNIDKYKYNLEKYNKPKILTYLKCDNKIIQSAKEYNKCKEEHKNISIYFANGDIISV
jgi:exodeoxyribonuclease VII large subunit